MFVKVCQKADAPDSHSRRRQWTQHRCSAWSWYTLPGDDGKIATTHINNEQKGQNYYINEPNQRRSLIKSFRLDFKGPEREVISSYFNSFRKSFRDLKPNDWKLFSSRLFQPFFFLPLSLPSLFTSISPPSLPPPVLGYKSSWHNWTGNKKRQRLKRKKKRRSSDSGKSPRMCFFVFSLVRLFEKRRDKVKKNMRQSWKKLNYIKYSYFKKENILKKVDKSIW